MWGRGKLRLRGRAFFVERDGCGTETGLSTHLDNRGIQWKVEFGGNGRSSPIEELFEASVTRQHRA